MTDSNVIATMVDNSNLSKLSEWLKQILKIVEVTVTFTEKDGSVRVMKCTLNPELLPTESEYPEKTTSIKKSNLDVITACDTGGCGWRSFSVSSVTNISFAVD
jgi:hypothetical protein